MTPHPKKIMVGLSGGVDSAVTALLLKQQGHDVHGIFMRNWEEDDLSQCTADQDLADARTVCEQLKIPFHTVNFAQTYWDHVFSACLDAFAKGLTPNPDIGCNKEIKFKALLAHAKSLGADGLATGHYAQISGPTQGAMRLEKGSDIHKDQSYFLYTLNQKQLAAALFPLGHLTKPEVRQIASDAGLHNHAKKDSTGICFIGERRFKTFLQEFILAQPGPIEDIHGRTLGQHDGVMFYTLGQRKGLHLGGMKNHDEKPWYVLDKDTARNALIVGQGHDHPRLFHRELIAEDLYWVSGIPPEQGYACSAKVRYRQQDQPCTLTASCDGHCHVTFDQPQWAITPGQAVVFYERNQCLGGGTITQRMNKSPCKPQRDFNFPHEP